MSNLEENPKILDQIFKETIKGYKNFNLVFCSVIMILNGIPIFNYQKKNKEINNEILSAIAAGAIHTGEFINSKLDINIEEKLEYVITGSDGHTALVKIKSPENFVLLASNADNTQIGTTIRFAYVFAKEIVRRIYFP